MAGRLGLAAGQAGGEGSHANEDTLEYEIGAWRGVVEGSDHGASAARRTSEASADSTINKFD